MNPEPWPRFGAFADENAPHDLPRLIQDCRALGLSAIQLWGPLLERSLVDPAAAEEIGGAFRDAHIEVVAVAGYSNLIAPDPHERERALARVERCLQIAPLLGTNVVATETGTLNPDSPWKSSPLNTSPDAWAALEESVTRLLETARGCGTVLAIEGYVNNVLARTDQLRRLLERFDSPHLAVVCDPYNYCSRDLLPDQRELTVACFDGFADRFAVAHLKDVSAEGAEHDTPEFGTGVFDQSHYLGLLRTRRSDLPLILEHLPWSGLAMAIERVRLLCQGLSDAGNPTEHSHNPHRLI